MPRTAINPNPCNRSGVKSLDRVARDPRVVEVWSEDEDGYWAQLAPGYNWEGCSCLHEWSARALIAALGAVEEGPTY